MIRAFFVDFDKTLMFLQLILKVFFILSKAQNLFRNVINNKLDPLISISMKIT